MFADNCPVLSAGPTAATHQLLFASKRCFQSWSTQYAQGATTPAVSIRETEEQTRFKLPITRIPRQCSAVQRKIFSLSLLTERKCCFSAHKVCGLEDIEDCSHRGCYSSRDAIAFKMLFRNSPCRWPDSKSYAYLTVTDQHSSLVPGTSDSDRFQKAELFWQAGLTVELRVARGSGSGAA